MKSHRSRNRQGLTLMEIMLVLVILGILGSMAAMFITTAREDALKKATKIEMMIELNSKSEMASPPIRVAQRTGVQLAAADLTAGPKTPLHFGYYQRPVAPTA